jgi:hypothetical protein
MGVEVVGRVEQGWAFAYSRGVVLRHLRDDNGTFRARHNRAFSFPGPGSIRRVLQTSMGHLPRTSLQNPCHRMDYALTELQ